jgi:spoIIIJ-associated protein
MISISDSNPVAAKIEEFLQTLLRVSGLELKFQILACNGHVQSDSAAAGTPPGALDQPELCVEFTGADTPLLTARNGELLHAIEHLAAKVVRFEPEEHDRISFDADNFKLLRTRELQLIAEAAAEKVRATGRPYSFPPMNSRERRLIHLALAAAGLPTASSSGGPRRFVVAYPEGQQPIEPSRPSTHDRTRAIRNSFRRR